MHAETALERASFWSTSAGPMQFRNLQWRNTFTFMKSIHGFDTSCRVPLTRGPRKEGGWVTRRVSIIADAVLGI